MPRFAATLSAVLAALVVLPHPAAAAEADATTHVEGIAARLRPHVPGAGSLPGVVIVERVGVVAGRGENGLLEVSTGLLAALRTDAELALILGYELARGASAEAGPVPRRGAPSERKADDDAVTAGMNALMEAGWDGKAALRAWDRLAPSMSSPLAVSENSYVDRRANAQRERTAWRAFRKTRQRSTAGDGPAVGEASYRQEVLAHLVGGVFVKPAPAHEVRHGVSSANEVRHGVPPPDPSIPRREIPLPAPAPVPPRPDPEEPTGAPWISYVRSGGITGWTARVSVSREGRVTSSASNDGNTERVRSPLGGSELVSLRTRLDLALTEPARRAQGNLALLRDGQVRTVEFTEDGQARTLVLSDGYALSAEDHDLIRVLEDLLRRP